jgi:hypothetical protein
MNNPSRCAKPAKSTVTRALIEYSNLQMDFAYPSYWHRRVRETTRLACQGPRFLAVGDEAHTHITFSGPFSTKCQGAIKYL